MIGILLLSQATFVTSPQVIGTNVVSAPLTITLEDSAGQKVKAGETLDMVLTSTSPTGVFSSSVDPWKTDNSLVVNSSFASRTFYYKDTVVGDYIITAHLRSRKSQKEWIAVQEISILSQVVSSRATSTIMSVTVSKKGDAQKSAVKKASVESTPPVTLDVHSSANTESNESDQVSPGFFSRFLTFLKRLFF